MPISFPFSQQLNFIHESATQSPHYCFREFIFQIIITSLHLTFFQWHKSFLFDSSQFGVMKFLSTRLICQDQFSHSLLFCLFLFELGNFFFSLFFPPPLLLSPDTLVFIEIKIMIFPCRRREARKTRHKWQNCLKIMVSLGWTIRLFGVLCFHYWGFSTLTPGIKIAHLCAATRGTIIFNPQIESNRSWKMGISVMFHICFHKAERANSFHSTLKYLQIQ